jgi:Holliday junction resolvase
MFIFIGNLIFYIVIRETMPTKTTQYGRSNYAYGRSNELKVARLVREHTGATRAVRSPGSRGPSDVTVYKDGKAKYDIQCKSSRASTKSVNIVSNNGISKLIKHSEKNKTVPLIAESKGNTTVVKYAKSNRTMIST